MKKSFFAFDGYHMIDENGVKSGYGYEFLRLISRYLDVDFEYVGYENSWEDMSDMLANGEIDLVTSAQATPERNERFAFSKSIGTSSAILTVKTGNDKIIGSDFNSFNGIRIGMLEGNSRNKDLAEYAEENNFTYTPVYYSMVSELEAALQAEEIDAALTSSLRHTENEYILDFFATNEFYAMTRLDDTELLGKINYAIDQLNATEGDWKNYLENKYYTHLEVKNLTFTNAEKEIIQKYANGEKTLTVSACPDKKPYAYNDHGKLTGILFDYFKKSADYVGIPYTVISPSDRTEYVKWCDNGLVDVTLDGRFQTMYQAELLGRTPSAPYTTMRLAKVMRRDFDGEINTLAIAKSQGIFGIEDGIIPHAEKHIVPTREAAMQAVLDGKADVAIVYLYSAQQFVNSDGTGLLTYTLLSEPSYDYHIAFSDTVPHELAGIFTKAIYAMPDGDFEAIASHYTAYKATNIDTITWIRIHPMYTLAICVVICFMILLLILFYERKRRVKTLRELVKKADRANAAKSEFLANVSHDIRTPMNAIIGISQLMEKEENTSEKLREYIKKINRSSNHLLGLINDVLDMSKIEASELSLCEEPFELIKQIEQIEDIIRTQSEQHGQSFNVKLININHNFLIADSARLRQILINILSNAVKYTPRGGNIDFEIEELSDKSADKPKYRFTVTDNGQGMSEEFLKHFFDPFAREKSSSINKIQGTGLGMSITKNLVDLMGGDISVKSELNKGTSITVTVNIKIDDSEDAVSEENSEPMLDGMNFLCAEDNELNAEILEASLNLYHASCTICPDGAELVKRFEASAPGEYNVIMTDIQMPVMNGLEAAKAIRKSSHPDAKTIPIFAMTANAFKDSIQNSLDAGMNAHIAKPLDMELLAKTIRNFSGGGEENGNSK